MNLEINCLNCSRRDKSCDFKENVDFIKASARHEKPEIDRVAFVEHERYGVCPRWKGGVDAQSQIWRYFREIGFVDAYGNKKEQK